MFLKFHLMGEYFKERSSLTCLVNVSQVLTTSNSNLVLAL